MWQTMDHIFNLDSESHLTAFYGWPMFDLCELWKSLEMAAHVPKEEFTKQMVEFKVTATNNVFMQSHLGNPETVFDN